MQLISYTSYLKGVQDGPTVVILGGTHGNEPVDTEVIEYLREDLDINKLKGEIYLFLGNPEACRQDQQFVDTDINRLFGEEFERIKKMKESEMNTEQKRVMEMAPILEKADCLIDLHARTNPFISFIYCEPSEKHLKIAHLFDTKYIVSASPDFRPKDLVSSIDNFVDNHGGVGITYEYGLDEDGANFDTILTEVKAVLQEVGSYDFNLLETGNENSDHLIIYKEIVPASKPAGKPAGKPVGKPVGKPAGKPAGKKFKFVKNFSNFDFVPKGEVIAIDGDKEITAERDVYIIFPRKELRAGKYACYLAYKA